MFSPKLLNNQEVKEMYNAKVINVSHRIDRWQQFQKDIEGVDIKCTKLSAVIRQPGSLGCLMSHQKAVKEAFRDKLPFVIVLEDDCIIPNKEDFNIRFPLIMNWAIKNMDSWTILNLGPTFTEPNSIVQDEIPLIKLNKGLCTHFIVYNKSIYTKIIDTRQGELIDVITSNLGVITTVPYLAIQRASFSDVERRQVDYTQVFRMSEDLLTRYLTAQREEAAVVGSPIQKRELFVLEEEPEEVDV